MNLAILASGRGSNAAAILDAIANDSLDARAVALITNREDVGALDVARAHNVPAHEVPRRSFASRGAQQRRMLEILQASDAEFVALAGFDAILRPFIVAAYPNRILNIHPSLLPAFAGGMAPKPQTDALRAGVKIAGCTVHVVTDHLDAGPIVAQAAVPVLPGDSVDSLSERILVQEHRVYPLALRWFAEDRVRIENGRVHIQSEESQALWPHPAP
jgi:phosphoribosylglycinamide formyltransferase-1